MTDYQRLIDNIRNLLQSANAATPDRVEGVATEYVIACSDVNDRLRQCGELLRQGLRSEAIEAAEAEPNLLNLVSLLDFPELPEWQRLMRSSRVLVAESPLIEIAAELNEAYALEQPVAALLKRHRLLALARSPLRDRLATLKHLARIDHANPVWQDDVRVYEKARHQEIHRAAESEYKSGNLVALEEMATDLESEDWLESPPTALATQVTKSLARLRREKALAELKVLEPQLNEAFSELDVNTARSVRERWLTAMAVVELADDDPLVERAAPALEWLEHQDREQSQESGFATAVAALENAIDDEVGAEKLERLAHAALRFDRPLPTLLEQRYRSRVASLELAGTRRIRLIAAAASVLILSVAAAIGYTMYRQGQATLVETHVDTLRRFVDQQLYEDADKHLSQLAETQPAVVGDARVQSIKVELANLQRAEKQRRADFQSAIEKAEKSAASTPDREALGSGR